MIESGEPRKEPAVSVYRKSVGKTSQSTAPHPTSKPHVMVPYGLQWDQTTLTMALLAVAYVASTLVRFYLMPTIALNRDIW